MTDLRTIASNLLDKTVKETDLGGQKHAGKVRDSYLLGDQRLIVVSDRISAFDHILGTIPLKGQLLNQAAAYWLEKTQDIAPNHLIKVVDPAAMLVKNCIPLKAEFVMRGYLAGTTETSILRSYEKGLRNFCGHRLPDGLSAHGKLPKNIMTPTTKGDMGKHDVNMSKEEILASGVVSKQHFEAAEEMAYNLFAFGQKHAAEKGLILVDTKYEFGVCEGQVMLIDEIHTPDSSRYWYQDDYATRMAAGKRPRSLDKEYVRRWMVDNHGFRGDGTPPLLDAEVRVEAALRYIENYETVTGSTFTPNTEDPAARLKKNLEGYLK